MPDNPDSRQGVPLAADDATSTQPQLLAAALDAVADPIVVTDAAGTILWVNRAFTSQNGWSREEVVGENPRILKSGATDPALYRDLWAALASGRGWAGEVFNRTRDGRDYRARLTVAPVIETAGGPTYFVGTHRDVTEQRRAEEALRRSEESFRTLIERLPDPLAVHRDGRLVYVNPKAIELLGYERPRDLVGRPVLETLHPDDRWVMQEGPPQGQGRELRFLRRDGVVVTAEITALRIAFDGEPSVLVAARDVSARKELTARMMQLDRAIAVGTLAAGVGHEINNPLAYVVANLDFAMGALGALEAELVAADAPAAQASKARFDELRENLAEAREGSDRIRRIVRDLRTFSQDAESVQQIVDLPEVIEASLKMTWNEIRHRSRLVKELGPTPPVAGSASKLGQVVVNLLVNAAQAIPEGHAQQNEIRVTTYQDGAGHAVIEVRDSGAGIAPELLPRIFDPFFTTKPVGQGTGLGLAICQGIVRDHGGEIRAESAPGRGALFRVRLPAARAEAEPEPSAPVVATPSPAGRRTRLLVIDDDAQVAGVVRRTLVAEHEVVVQTRGREALELLDRGERFDAIVCDLLMPDLTGMDLHAALLARHPREAARMLFLTGGAFTPAARSFLEAGPKRYVEKPFDQQALLAAVRSILALPE